MAGGAGGREVGRISIRVVPDLKGFRRKVKSEIEQAEASLDVDVDVNPNTKGFRKKVDAATKGMKAEVDVDVNRSMLGRLRQRIGDALSNIKAPSFGSGINPAGYAVIATGILAVLAPAIGLLTTSLLALPGLLAAVATPVGAIALGLDGIKAAAARLAAPFEALKTTMSEFTEAQFTPVFDKLGAIFPMLSRTLPRVSQGVADMATAFVDTITSSSGMAKIETTIDNIAAALTKAAPGVEKFTDGILGLIESFTGKSLSGIADWFSQAGDSFSKWVDKITRPDWFTGKSPLETAFEGLGDTLRTILDLAGRLAEKGIEFMNSPEKVEKFQTALSNVATVMERIVDASAGFFAVLDRIENSHSNRTLEDEGTFAWIREGFDPKNLFGPNTVDWSSMFSGLRESAATAFANVVTTVGGAVAQIKGVISGVGQSIAGMWNGVVSAAQSAWNTVVSTVSGAISSAVSAVVSGGAQILAEVGSWPGKIAGAVGNMGGILVGAGKALMDGLLSGIRSGLQAVLDFAGGIADKIAAVKGPLPYDRKVLTPAGEAMMHGLDDGLRKGFTSVLDRARGMADELAGAFGPQTIDTTWSSDFDAGKLVNAGADFVDANLGQLMGDLGIGGGALTAALDQGTQFGLGALTDLLGGLGGGTTINVNSVDEAVAADKSIAAKKALQYYRR